MCYAYRVTELPPGVAHLKLSYCSVESIVLPTGRQLRSLHLESRGNSRAEPTCVPINFLGWLEKTLPQATVQMDHVELSLGALSMEETAKKLSELATYSINLQCCTLLRHNGCPSTHSVADLAHHMGQHFGKAVTVTCIYRNMHYCKIVAPG